MPSTFKSPFATGFKSAVNRGVSYNQAVSNLARRSGVTENKVWESLYKAGCCNRQKFNGQWIYFPNFNAKWSASTGKASQYNTWQCFIEWCITSGICTPATLHKKCGSQNAFMNACKTWWNSQFSATTVKAGKKSSAKRTSATKSATKTVTKTAKKNAKTGVKTTAKKNTSRTVKARKTTTGSGSYRFPVARKSAARKAA